MPGANLSLLFGPTLRRRLVYRDDFPVSAGAGSGDVIDAGYRQVVDGKVQAGVRVGLDAEGHGEGGADGAAVGDGDDIAAPMGLGQPFDDRADPDDDIGEPRWRACAVMR